MAPDFPTGTTRDAERRPRPFPRRAWERGGSGGKLRSPRPAVTLGTPAALPDTWSRSRHAPRPPARLRLVPAPHRRGAAPAQPPQPAQGRPRRRRRADPPGPAPRTDADGRRPGGARASSSCGWPAGRARSTPSTPSPTARRRTAGRSASPSTKLPGVLVCEHLPKLAGDARPLHRHPLGRLPAQQPRAEHGDADGQPAGRAAHQPGGPTATRPSRRSSRSSTGRTTRPCRPTSRSCESRSHLAFGGYLGKQYDPFLANDRRPAAGLRPRRQGHRAASPAASCSSCRPASTPDRLADRRSRCCSSFDRLRADIDAYRRDGRRWTGTASRRSRC